MLDITKEKNSNFLSRYVAEEMASRLEFIALKPAKIAIVGEEGGYQEQLLKEKYPHAEIITQTNSINSSTFPVDLIFANLVLPWVPLQETLNHWKNVLRPEGMLMFSTLGPDTLKEMAEWRGVTVLPTLMDMHDLGDALVQTRFSDPVLDVERLTIAYNQKEQLIQEMCANHMIVTVTGAENPSCPREEHYTLTFELVFGHVWMPHPKMECAESDPGVVKIPLSHLRGRKNA